MFFLKVSKTFRQILSKTRKMIGYDGCQLIKLVSHRRDCTGLVIFKLCLASTKRGMCSRSQMWKNVLTMPAFGQNLKLFDLYLIL